MGEIAIRATGISKAYRIDHQPGSRYRTLRESIASVIRRPRERSKDGLHETVWALKDVSFWVNRGEALGIIGRNGAGKSTLLKILSRITSPTAGRAEVFGRLGSLLEVGTGFHPELTGRENVFLNGAILGMTRREIQLRFDEIVDFAETERYLDTPVKRYSTGMYMRLAFAVAAHLETDILLVDEVLAVGDSAFQQKCLGKMEDVATQGRTVLFISHNLAAISQLCANALLLDGGGVAAHGPTQEVVDSYLGSMNAAGHINLGARSHADGTGGALFEHAEVQDIAGRRREDFSVGDDICVVFGLRLSDSRPRTKLAVSIRTSDGVPIAHAVDDDSKFELGVETGEWSVRVIFRDVRLYPGSYRISLWAVDHANTETFDYAEDCLTFRIVDGGRMTMRWLPRHSGLLFMTPDWQSRPRHIPPSVNDASSASRGSLAGVPFAAPAWRAPEAPPREHGS